jgi:hypothetical protein
MLPRAPSVPVTSVIKPDLTRHFALLLIPGLELCVQPGKHPEMNNAGY